MVLAVRPEAGCERLPKGIRRRARPPDVAPVADRWPALEPRWNQACAEGRPLMRSGWSLSKGLSRSRPV